MPINYRLSRPGDRLHPQRLRREGVRVPRALRRAVIAAAADEAGMPAAARLAHGTVPGFTDVEAVLAAQPDTLPEDRTAGAAMHYTSGTTGKPKGVARVAVGDRPRRDGRAVHRLLRRCSASRTATTRCTCRRRRTTTPRSRPSPATRCTLGHTRRLHGQVGPGGDARQDRALPGHAHAHGADAVPSACCSSPRRCGTSTTCRRCAGPSTPPRRARSTSSSKMLDWWGPVIWEYYARHRGRRHDRHRPRSGSSTRAPSVRRGRSRS